MKRIRWDDAFPPVDESFERSMDRAFEAIRKEKKMKRKSKVTLLLAAVLVLALAGTAIAVNEQMGILDMLQRSTRRYGTEAIREPANEKNLQEVIENVTDGSVCTSRVRYTAKQVIMDAESMSVSIECEALDPEHVMIIPHTVDVEKDRCTQGGDVLPQGSDSAEYPTVAEYAAQTGKEIVCTVVYKYERDPFGGGCEYTMQNGKITYLLTAAFVNLKEPSSDGLYHSSLHVMDYFQADDDHTLYNMPHEDVEMKISAEGKAQEARDTFIVSGPIEMEYLTIDEVKFERTPQALLMSVTYTGHEDLTPEQCVMLDFSSVELMDDAESTDFREPSPIELNEGLKTVKSKELAGYDTGCYILPGWTFRDKKGYAPISEWPEAFYLRFYLKEFGEWGDPVEIPVTFD